MFYDGWYTNCEEAAAAGRNSEQCNRVQRFRVVRRSDSEWYTYVPFGSQIPDGSDEVQVWALDGCDWREHSASMSAYIQDILGTLPERQQIIVGHLFGIAGFEQLDERRLALRIGCSREQVRSELAEASEHLERVQAANPFPDWLWTGNRG